MMGRGWDVALAALTSQLAVPSIRTDRSCNAAGSQACLDRVSQGDFLTSILVRSFETTSTVVTGAWVWFHLHL